MPTKMNQMHFGRKRDGRLQELDEDGLLAATLDEMDERYERTIPLHEWCKCGRCSLELLANAREFRCCHEVGPAMGTLMFDGSFEGISCATEHQNYVDTTKIILLEHVGPILRDKNNRPTKEELAKP